MIDLQALKVELLERVIPKEILNGIDYIVQPSVDIYDTFVSNGLVEVTGVANIIAGLFVVAWLLGALVVVYNVMWVPEKIFNLNPRQRTIAAMVGLVAFLTVSSRWPVGLYQQLSERIGGVTSMYMGTVSVDIATMTWDIGADPRYEVLLVAMLASMMVGVLLWQYDVTPKYNALSSFMFGVLLALVLLVAEPIPAWAAFTLHVLAMLGIFYLISMVISWASVRSMEILRSLANINTPTKGLRKIDTFTGSVSLGIYLAVFATPVALFVWMNTMLKIAGGGETILRSMLGDTKEKKQICELEDGEEVCREVEEWQQTGILRLWPGGRE